MANPSSRPWTSGAGDGSTPYTAAQWASIYRNTFSDGVLFGAGGSLAVSGTASPLTVASGAAFVDGIFFEDPTPTNLSISTPSATTGGHVILRADWSARQVRIVAVLNAVGNTNPPALTQNSGTLYEIRLATFTIAPNGAITLTDARQYARFRTRVSSAMLEDGAVSTAAKIANGIITAAKFAANAVIDALGYTPVNKAGDTMSDNLAMQPPVDSGSITGMIFRTAAGVVRWVAGHQPSTGIYGVYDALNNRFGLQILGNLIAGPLGPLPQINARIGGSSNNWATPGSTIYSVNEPLRVFIGATNIGVPQNSVLTTVNVSFPQAFSNVPFILSFPSQYDSYKVHTELIAFNTHIQITAVRQNPNDLSQLLSVDVYWMVIGPVSN